MPHTVTNIEGFEIQDVNAWNFNTGGIGGIFNFVGGGVQRSGLFCGFQVNQGWTRLPVGFDAFGAPYGGGIFTFQAGIARVYFNVPFLLPGALTRIVSFGAGIAAPGAPGQATVEIDVLGRLSLNGFMSGAPTILVPGQYYRLELKNDQTALRAELLIDGTVEVSLVLLGLGSVDYLQLGDERAGANIFAAYDDVLIESHRTNGNQVDYPGAGNVQRLLPTSVGTDNAWTGVPDNVNKHLNVDETLPNDLDYIESNGISDQTFGLTNLGALVNPVVPPGDIVRAVRIANRIRIQAGAPQWRMARIRSGVTVAETAATIGPALGVAGTRTGAIWQNDPNTGTL